MSIKYFLIAILIVVITASGNFILKIGASKPSWFSFVWMPPINAHFILGAFLFGVSLIIYMFLLKDLPLFVAQSLIALQYVAIMLIARFALDEKMSSSDLVGMALIVGGILLVAHRGENA